jgi:hypothetical protein
VYFYAGLTHNESSPGAAPGSQGMIKGEKESKEEKKCYMMNNSRGM